MTPSPKFFFYFIALITIFQAQFARAYENDSPLGRQNYEQNYLDRLHFRTPGQEVLATFDFSPDVYNRTTTSVKGSVTNQSTRDRFPISLGATLGITDLLSFQVSEGYLFNSVQTNINDRTGVQTTPSSSGLSDPNFRVSYRYLGGLVGTTFGDAFINFSPSAGDSQAATSRQDGNYLRGGTTLELGSDIYQVVQQSEFSFGASWIYNTSRNIDSSNPSNNEVGTNFSNFDVRLRYRYHLNKYFYTQAQGILYMPYSMTYSYYNSTNGRMQGNSYPFFAAPTVSFGYLPTNFTLLTAGVTYTSYTRTYSSGSALLHELTLNFGLSFLL